MLQAPAEHVGRAVRCPKCGTTTDVPADVPPLAQQAPGPGQKSCATCGAAIHAQAEICPKCGVRQQYVGYGASPTVNSNRLAAGILAILIGTLGVHKFILGYTTQGVIMLLGSIIGGLLTCGMASIVFWVIGIVEGIIYLTKSDAEFHEIYEVGRREWF
jgi:TM2 domain-containing membrane protein YozV